MPILASPKSSDSPVAYRSFVSFKYLLAKVIASNFLSLCSYQKVTANPVWHVSFRIEFSQLVEQFAKHSSSVIFFF